MSKESTDIADRLFAEMEAKDTGWDDYTLDMISDALDTIRNLRAENADQGECIMLMRGHLSRAGIECTFADDAASFAANRIIALEQTCESLRMHLADTEAALAAEMADTLGQGWE